MLVQSNLKDTKTWIVNRWPKSWPSLHQHFAIHRMVGRMVGGMIAKLVCNNNLRPKCRISRKQQ